MKSTGKSGVFTLLQNTGFTQWAVPPFISFIPYIATGFERLPDPSFSFMPLHPRQLLQNCVEFGASPSSTSVVGAVMHFREAGESGCYPHQHLLEEESTLGSLWAAVSTRLASSQQGLPI